MEAELAGASYAATPNELTAINKGLAVEAGVQRVRVHGDRRAVHRRRTRVAVVKQD
jgi:hypothetical protein